MITRAWLLILLLLTSQGIMAGTVLPTKVLDALKVAGIPASDVAIYVQAVDESKPLLNHQADKALNPASVMKLVTTNAALDVLSPVYRWKTEVYRDGAIKNWVLGGNLMIKGYGDPSFKAQDFWRLLMSLRQAGVKKINGDLWLDKSYFLTNTTNNQAFDAEKWRAYNAQPSAFLVNGRNTSFRFSHTGDGVSVAQEFDLPEVTVINHLKPVSGDCTNWRSRIKYDVKTDGPTAEVTFNGDYATECGERFLELSLFDDELYAFYTFKKIWHELGGEFDGALKVKPVPVSAVKMLEQQSEPLGSVVRDINKWSNNLMARQLLLTIVAEKNDRPATEAKGAGAIQAWLNQNGLNFNELVIENGSGLSRQERISAEHLGQLLVRAYRSPVMPEFMSSLPILSMDGTVEKRLKNSESNGRAHLKTGSLNGVSAIAGYVLDTNQHRHVLVMLVNHAQANQSRAAQDALIEWVYQRP